MSMYVDKKARRDRQGLIYYSVLYRDESQKLRRLPKDKHPRFTTFETADSWVRSQAAVIASKKAYIERKLSWKSQYYKFEELIKNFATWQQTKAPNSWKMTVYYLEQWICPFFLQEKKSANVNDWHLLFREFTDWLRAPDAMEKKGKKQPLAVSTVNNIVKALNSFLSYLLDYNLIDPDSVKKCPAMPEHMVAHRTFKDVILEPEMRRVYEAMKKINVAAAEFFLVLWHTGMRFSELYGLPMTALYRGDIKAEALRDELAKCNIEYKGYLYLDSQPETDDRKRAEDKSIPRKPLKACKEIGPKWGRVIPIRTTELWNILVARHRVQNDERLKKTYGGDKASYVLFGDLEYNKAVNTLKQAYESLGLAPKSYHCCRHSFTTLLVGETRSFFLVRSITGHRKDKSFEKYLHIFESISMEAQQEEQELDFI